MVLFSLGSELDPVLWFCAGMMEHGLVDSSHYRTRSSVSEELVLVDSTCGAEEFVSVSVTDFDTPVPEGEGLFEAPPTGEAPPSENSSLLKPPSRTSPESSESDWETLDPSSLEEAAPKEAELHEQSDSAFIPTPSTPITVQPQALSGQGNVVPGLVSGLEEDQYGLPLAVFTKVQDDVCRDVSPLVHVSHLHRPHPLCLFFFLQGYLCLPYMALQQHHLLSDVAVRGFVAGATNILFHQQRHLSDAVVEVRVLKSLEVSAGQVLKRRFL